MWANMASVLSFSLFRVPVSVRPSFLLVAALLGLVGAQEPIFVAAWVVIVFVSILIHELGHALTARAFGAEVEIELNGLGGLTRWGLSSGELGPGRRAVIAASGSAVGVLFGGLVWLVASRFGPYSGLAYFFINTTILVNLFWGLLNWLPIRPLDGGHLLSSLLQKVVPRRAEAVARIIFTTTAALALVLAIRFNMIFVAVLAGWLLFTELSLVTAKRPQVPIQPFSYDEPPDQEVMGRGEEEEAEEPIEAEWHEIDASAATDPDEPDFPKPESG